MTSILKSIAAMSCGFVLSLGLPNATLAINNFTQELEQQEADEKADNLSDATNTEEETAKGIVTIQGEVLRVKRDNYLVRKNTGDLIRLHIDDNTQKTGTVHQGDRIVAKMDEDSHVLLIHPVH